MFYHCENMAALYKHTWKLYGSCTKNVMSSNYFQKKIAEVFQDLKNNFFVHCLCIFQLMYLIICIKMNIVSLPKYARLSLNPPRTLESGNKNVTSSKTIISDNFQKKVAELFYDVQTLNPLSIFCEHFK